MNGNTILVIVVAIAIIVIAAVVLLRQGHPEDAADHEPYDPERPTPGSRPAGPGAEGMNPTERGEIIPGPDPT